MGVNLVFIYTVAAGGDVLDCWAQLMWIAVLLSVVETACWKPKENSHDAV